MTVRQFFSLNFRVQKKMRKKLYRRKKKDGTSSMKLYRKKKKSFQQSCRRKMIKNYSPDDIECSRKNLLVPELFLESKSGTGSQSRGIKPKKWEKKNSKKRGKIQRADFHSRSSLSSWSRIVALWVDLTTVLPLTDYFFFLIYFFSFITEWKIRMKKKR